MKKTISASAAAGYGMDAVAKTTVLLSGMENLAAMSEACAAFFGEGARSAVEVARLPKDALVEIEAVAAL